MFNEILAGEGENSSGLLFGQASVHRDFWRSIIYYATKEGGAFRADSFEYRASNHFFLNRDGAHILAVYANGEASSEPRIKAYADLDLSGLDIENAAYLRMTGKASAPPGLLAGYGGYWVKNDSPSVPMFTDDAGSSFPLMTQVSDDTTPELGGDLGAGGFNISDLGDVTFKAGASGGTLRTGTNVADKIQLQAYDVDGGVYITLIEADAGNTVRLQIPVDYLDLEDAADPTKIARFDASGITTATARTFTLPDASGTLLLNVVEDTTPQLGGNLDAMGYTIDQAALLYVNERAAASTSFAGRGQFWVRNDTPCQPWFTDDAGTGRRLMTQVVNDAAPTLGGHLAANGYQLQNAAMLSLVEAASAPGSMLAGLGRFWVKNDAPCVPMFTDDAGNGYGLMYEEAPDIADAICIDLQIQTSVGASSTRTIDIETTDHCSYLEVTGSNATISLSVPQSTFRGKTNYRLTGEMLVKTTGAYAGLSVTTDALTDDLSNVGDPPATTNERKVLKWTFYRTASVEHLVARWV